MSKKQTMELTTDIIRKPVERAVPDLFKYFEYVGDDFETDMAKLAANPKNKEWLTHRSVSGRC